MPKGMPSDEDGSLGTSGNDTISDAKTAEPVADHQETASAQIKVDDHLATLSNEELEVICLDRGFEIESSSKDGKPTRQDYLDAARRCLNLEKEMDAILAEHPELAAELDKEVERMRAMKEALEKEREEMMALKAKLEKQLEQATGDNGGSTTALTAKHKAQHNPGDMSFQEVLIYTFTELVERVRADIRFLGKVLEPVLTPLRHYGQIAWRHAKPYVIKLWKELVKKLKEIVRNKTDDENTVHSSKATAQHQAAR